MDIVKHTEVFDEEALAQEFEESESVPQLG